MREVEPAGLAKLGEQEFVQPLPDARLLPVAQATPAGHARAEAELLRQPLPSDAGREHEQDSIQHSSIVDSSAARVLRAPLHSGQERLDQPPELVVDWFGVISSLLQFVRGVGGILASDSASARSRRHCERFGWYHARPRLDL